MPWIGGEYAPVGSPEFEQMRKWVDDDHVGGIVLSIGMPLSYAAKINEMQRRSRVPLLIASDMENGSGMRLGNIYAFPSLLPQGGGTVFPPVMALGATGSAELAYKLGVVLGREARAVGVEINFGPVLDVNSNPLNPIINTRSFGENPELVSTLATAYIRGARSTGLMTTGKHFPGHGDTGTDSHIELPTISANKQKLDTVDLPPFKAAVNEGVDAIMTAHIAVLGVEGPDAPPATLSHLFMTDVLRKDLGFRGVLFTDAMTMGGVAKKYGATQPLIMAMNAGADILLMPRDVKDAITTIVSAVDSGHVARERIDDAVRHVLTAKARAGLIDGRLVKLDAVDSIVNTPENAALAQEVAEKSITLARDEKSSVPILPTQRRILSLTYASASDVIAGRIFNQTLESEGKIVRGITVDSRTTEADWNAIRAAADSFDVVIASIYIVPTAFAGAIQVKGDLPALVDTLVKSGRNVVAVSFGSPYVFMSVPNVPAYLLAWGPAPVSQRAAARALMGDTPITGHLPVSIPPALRFGEGLIREARRSGSPEK
jgi:beta-N-acetylhexosaminidase